MCIAMKSSLLFVIVFALRVANSEWQKDSLLPDVNDEESPKEVINNMVVFDEAMKRKDMITVLYMILDLYEDAEDHDENFFIKYAIRYIKLVLKKIYPIYVTIFPNKKSSDDTTSLDFLKKAIDNDYAQGAAGMYSNLEEFIMAGVQNFL